LATLAEVLRANVDSVGRAIRRGKGKGVFAGVTGPDGIHRIALVEKRSA
jgi:hypothetical protein